MLVYFVSCLVGIVLTGAVGYYIGGFWLGIAFMTIDAVAIANVDKIFKQITGVIDDAYKVPDRR